MAPDDRESAAGGVDHEYFMQIHAPHKQEMAAAIGNRYLTTSKRQLTIEQRHPVVEKRYQVRLHSLLRSALLLLPLAGCARAAPPPAFSAADSLAIDSLYTVFREAYRDLDAARVTALYGADAVYGQPGGGGFTVGQGHFASSFGSFFDFVRADSGYLELRFRFVKRFRSPTLASDAGYYWLRTVGRDSTTTPGVGKFVTVMARDTSGRWRFILDSYSGASLAAFDSAPSFEP